MKADIRLFIEDKEVEFSKDPQILFNYKLTDITNPTAVKNGYTKSITIPGTNTNNNIFGQIWNFERVQKGGLFNPIKKASFVIYLNGNVFEKGYCKLDNVNMKGNNNLEYTVTLYGGLGQFFQTLTYGTDPDSSTKLRLADLSFVGSNDWEPNIDFKINKENVKAAWNYLNMEGDDGDGLWRLINFAPCYNGIPSDFGSDKVLINTPTASAFEQTHTDGDVTYRTVDGYALGECDSDLTSDEVFDYRSYLQRPVIKMNRIIEACCNPENNGGWQVDLDTHFFNVRNPYWWDSWMTLPLLKDLDIPKGTETTITDAILNYKDSRLFQVTVPSAPLSEYSNLSMGLRIKFRPTTSTTSSELFSSAFYTSSANKKNKVQYYNAAGCVIVQLWALDDKDNIIGQSKAYMLGSTMKNEYGHMLNKEFYDPNQSLDVNPQYDMYMGRWVKNSDGEYVFTPNSTNKEMAIQFSFNDSTKINKIYLKVMVPWQETIKYGKKKNYYVYDFKENITNGGAYYTSSGVHYPMYTILHNNGNTGALSREEAEALNRVYGDFQFEITNFSLVATDTEAFFSDTEITKDKLLSTEYTPCDYLLSYCKMFGLYFYINPDEEPTKEGCDKGVVHICDRHTFYDRDTVENLNDLIDFSKQIKITPQSPASKFYDFSVEETESDAGNSYKQTYGYEYGRQLINTGYDFDSKTTELYDGNVFKGGIMVREKDKYFSKPGSDGTYSYVRNGFTYHLFNKNDDGDYDTCDIEFPVSTIPNSPINNIGLSRVDSYSKLQCHTEDNEGGDGDHILLFQNGSIQTPVTYYITDDTQEMYTLNDGEPCWFLTMSEYDLTGKQIGIKTTKIPYFSRYMQLTADEGTLVHSWDFGNPMVQYAYNTYNTEEMGIYSKWWKKFIGDVYSENTITISCYVNFKSFPPSSELMRKFYWFQNAIWRINSIKDWNVGSLDSVQCEFIKVQDLNNYDVEKIQESGTWYIILDNNTVGAEGGTITGYVYRQDGGYWLMGGDDMRFESYDASGNYTYYDVTTYCTPYKSSGLVKTNFSITIPANTSTSKLTFYLSLIDNNDEYLHTSWTQDGNTADPYITIPVTKTPMDYDYNKSVQISIESNTKYNLSITDKTE